MAKASQVGSLILRFRDLSTSPGKTIEEHSRIIEDKGRVYWGWWNKLGEVVPSQTFIRLHKTMESEPVQVLLYDSGRDQLYKAQCGGIDWENDLEPVATPDREATPEYYSDRKCRAWFVLVTKPEKVEQSDLQHWSYFEVDEFFETGESPYGRFHHKRVHSTEELQHQNRTIWFVTPFNGDVHETHEILLTDPQQLEPHDFARDFRTTVGDSLLWLSDLHFSEDDHHKFPLEASPGKVTLPHALELALDWNGLKERIGGVLVSGDFTWKSSDEEYRQAGDCIARILRNVGQRPEAGAGLADFDLLVCPGNHDLPFSETPQVDGSPVESVIGNDKVTRSYREFYRRFFNKSPNRFLCSGRKFLLGGRVPVEIAALNSSFLEQTQGLFQGHGFVGRDQLDEVAKSMGWKHGTVEQLPVRVLMLHHHLLPVTYRDLGTAGGNYSVTLDAEAVMRWIVKHDVRIVLHGHQHQPFCVKVARHPQVGSQIDADKPQHESWVLGMGSTGVEHGHLGEIGKNLFAILSFQTEAVEYRLFSVHPVHQSERIWEIRLPLVS